MRCYFLKKLKIGFYFAFLFSMPYSLYDNLIIVSFF